VRPPAEPSSAGCPRLLLGSANPGKLRELRAILASVPVELLGLDDLPGRDGLGEPPGVAETGETFLDNALIKARAYAAWSGLAALADDSGLEVDALGGAPGVRSARYAGDGATDQANLDKLLRDLAAAGVPPKPEHRAARFRCAAVLADPGPAGLARTAGLRSPASSAGWRTWHAEGVWEGHLLDAPRGSGGFGYDPVFVPTGWDRTSAEVDQATKDAVSHRGRAFRALRPAIEAWAAAHTHHATQRPRR
jgi:XTP/dITP diphosphohydrolase